MDKPLVPEDIGRRQDAVQRGLVCEYLRFALARALGGIDSENYFRARWPNARGEIFTFKGDPVAAGSTTGWGSPISELSKYSAALVETLRPLSVLGRMTGFRRVPFNTKFPRFVTGGSVSWVGQGMVKPLSPLSLETIEFGFSKLAGIIAFTKELAQNSDPSVEELVRADMLAAIAAFSDQQFLDPNIGAVADVSPASITFGAVEVESSGSTADQVEADMASLFASVTTNKANAYLLMREDVAIALARLRTTSGDRLFPEISTNGTIWRVPILTSNNVPTDPSSPSNDLIVLVDAAEVFLAEGDIEFEPLQHVSLQMDTAPDSPDTASTVTVSLWQRNLVGIGVRRFIRWQRRREGAVAYISGIEL